MAKGVFQAKKKNGDIYYRASVHFKNRHISLGSYSSEECAAQACKEAEEILREGRYGIEDYQNDVFALTFEKFIVLLNFRDNGVYVKNPIYLYKRFFCYYLSEQDVLKFDVDDLFYYSEHKIMKRGGHLFVADFGMQVTLPSRYGIKNYAVEGRDYRFVNGDNTDYRYGNIEIFTRYHGVTPKLQGGRMVYEARIHVNGDWVLGRYVTEIEAAVAYNKAALYLWEYGETKQFPVNYIEELKQEQYKQMLDVVPISRHFQEAVKKGTNRKQIQRNNEK